MSIKAILFFIFLFLLIFVIYYFYEKITNMLPTYIIKIIMISIGIIAILFPIFSKYYSSQNWQKNNTVYENSHK